MAEAARRPPAPDCNRLWSLSQGICAHPDCKRPLVKSDEGAWVTLGEIAHIRAHSPDGPRYDPNWPTDMVDSYENCMLLCRDHHRLIDHNSGKYPVDVLVDWKHQHEASGGPLATANNGFDGLLEPPPEARLFRLPASTLESLRTLLTEESRVALVGIAGAGKTQAARHWFTSSQIEYTYRWWVRGDSRESLEGDIAALAPFLRIADWTHLTVEALASRVLDELKRTTGWLLVVDNAPNPEETYGLVPTGGGHTIITSQNQGWEASFPTHHVSGFDDRESLALLRASPRLAHETDGALAPVVELCAGLPLALDQASSYIATTGIPVDRYVALLRERRTDVLRRGGVMDSTVADLIELALDEVGADARDLLGVLSFLAPVPIKLAQLPAFGGDIDYWDDLRLQDALGSLRSFSLLQREGDTIVAHELALEMVRSHLEGESEFTALMQAEYVLLEQLPELPGETYEWPVMEQLLPHARAIMSYADLPSARQLVWPMGAIMGKVGMYLQRRGQPDEGRKLQERAVRLVQVHEPDALSQLGTLTHNLAESWASTGDLDRAEELHRDALSLKERADGPNSMIVGISCGALGAVLEKQGRRREALPMYLRGLEIHRLNGDHRWVANALIDLAGIARWESDLDLAESLLDQAIAEAELDPAAHSELFGARLQLAYVEAERGNLRRAAELATQARNNAVSANDKTREATALAAHGGFLVQRGEGMAGVVLLERAVALWEQVAESEPVHAAKTLGTLGDAHCRVGAPELGRPLLEDSLEQLQSLLPKGDEAVAVGRLLLGQCYVLLGAQTEAQIVLQRLVADGNPQSKIVLRATEMLSTLG